MNISHPLIVIPTAMTIGAATGLTYEASNKQFQILKRDVDPELYHNEYLIGSNYAGAHATYALSAGVLAAGGYLASELLTKG